MANNKTDIFILMFPSKLDELHALFIQPYPLYQSTHQVLPPVPAPRHSTLNVEPLNPQNFQNRQVYHDFSHNPPNNSYHNNQNHNNPHHNQHHQQPIAKNNQNHQNHYSNQHSNQNYYQHSPQFTKQPFVENQAFELDYT